MTPVTRQTGATLCAVARCPNRLGKSPYRFCVEHIPPDYRERAEHYATIKRDPRRARALGAGKSRERGRQSVLSLLRYHGELDRKDIRQRAHELIPDDALYKAIRDLVATGEVLRLSHGTYRLADGLIRGQPQVRGRILSALADGQRTKADLRRAVPTSFSTFRDALAGLVRARKVRNVAPGRYEVMKT